MVCKVDGCKAVEWVGNTLTETEAKGWRHHRDGKSPQLAVGAALCPDHVDEAPRFAPGHARAR